MKRRDRRTSAKEPPWRQEGSQEGMVAERSITQGLERVLLPRGEAASGACGNGQCQES